VYSSDGLDANELNLQAGWCLFAITLKIAKRMIGQYVNTTTLAEGAKLP